MEGVDVDVFLHVLDAVLSWRRIELDEFDGGAGDFGVGEAGGEHAVYEVGEG